MLFTLVLAGRVYSSGVPEEPMLRMEMGMHSAWITSIGIDPQNQFIVTGSQDKTVRLWELSTESSDVAKGSIVIKSTTQRS